MKRGLIGLVFGFLIGLMLISFVRADLVAGPELLIIPLFFIMIIVAIIFFVVFLIYKIIKKYCCKTKVKGKVKRKRK